MKRFLNIRFRRTRPGLALLGALAIAATPAPGATNDYWTALKIDPNIYDTPYRVTLFNPQNGEDADRLWSQTKWIFLYGVAAVGVLAALPNDFTGWDTEDNIFSKWKDNVRRGPVWDRDKWYINYIGHPYFGGVYYQVARKSGYRQWDAFVYTFLMSTFYWEYGVEAFAEEPSIQDLVVHPVLGWVYGEWAFQTERKIRAGSNTVAGSKILGNTALTLLDPIDSIGRAVNRITGRKTINAGYGYFSYTATPSNDETDHRLLLNMQVPLGGSKKARHAPPARLDDHADPVDTGITGISIGHGRTQLDSKWAVKDGSYTRATLGLYFSPRWSVRLAYAQGDLCDRTTEKSLIYENYSLDAQRYFNHRRTLRPYLAAGFGEQMWDKDLDRKTFQINGGFGLHWQIHRKWSLQADWILHHSLEHETSDQEFNIGILYRFGQGEHRNW